MKELQNKLIKVVRTDLRKETRQFTCRIINSDDNFLFIEQASGVKEFVPVRLILRMEVISEFPDDNHKLGDERGVND